MQEAQWYVWLVWRYEDSVGVGESGPMMVVGVFSSRDKALEAAYPGCGITMLAFDESVIGNPVLPVQWIES